MTIYFSTVYLILMFFLFVLSFFFYLSFVSRTFTNHWTAREGGGHSINSSLPLPPASQTLRHQPGDYCRELTSAHSQQPHSNREPLVSERKSLTTKLRALFIDNDTNHLHSLLKIIKINPEELPFKLRSMYSHRQKKYVRRNRRGQKKIKIQEKIQNKKNRQV